MLSQAIPSALAHCPGGKRHLPTWHPSTQQHPTVRSKMHALDLELQQLPVSQHLHIGGVPHKALRHQVACLRCRGQQCSSGVYVPCCASTHGSASSATPHNRTLTQVDSLLATKGHSAVRRNLHPVKPGVYDRAERGGVRQDATRRVEWGHCAPNAFERIGGGGR